MLHCSFEENNNFYNIFNNTRYSIYSFTREYFHRQFSFPENILSEFSQHSHSRFASRAINHGACWANVTTYYDDSFNVGGITIRSEIIIHRLYFIVSINISIRLYELHWSVYMTDNGWCVTISNNAINWSMKKNHWERQIDETFFYKWSINCSKNSHPWVILLNEQNISSAKESTNCLTH